MKNVNCNHGNAQPQCPPDWFSGAALYCYWLQGNQCKQQREALISIKNGSINGQNDFLIKELTVLPTNRAEAASLFFPPEVAAHVVKLACERPDDIGRSLSQWFCQDLASQLISEDIVTTISAETIRRILANHKLKPWRVHMWLSPKHPRDETFYTLIQEIIKLYTRTLCPNEMVLCFDEKTSLQPRPRKHPTKPALPGSRPNLVEHEYERAGALQLFAAFDTRTGSVYGQCYDRKRQTECIQFLEYLEKSIDSTIKTIHIVADNVSVHHGKQVRKWLKKHPRFRFHFTPVHCSWMNQVEQWFSILQRKRFRIADFASKDDLRQKIYQFITEWNQHAHPFNWTTNSVSKVMANAPQKMVA
jgi:transposase